MKQFLKYFLACLLAIVISGFVLMFIFFGFVGKLASKSMESVENPAVAIKDKSILEVDLSKKLGENTTSNVLSILTGGNSEVTGLYDVISALNNAASDSKIKGILIKADGNVNGYATSEQLREAIKSFKKSGKFVYAYGDAISQNAYYVASVADSIFINPMGTVEFLGLSSNMMFYKGALDKLQVEPEIFYCGKFKSATEPVRAYKMSDENRQQIASYQKDIWNTIVSAVQEKTKADTATINNIMRTAGIENANDALKYKFVDGLKYKDEIENLLCSQTETKEVKDLNITKLAEYVKSNNNDDNSGDQIALLIAEGNIVDGEGSNGDAQIADVPLIKEIRKIRENDKIKAVVLRVNSGGGSALASEKILRELNLLKQTKKLVVSMGDYAASGGYYIASNADSIFALNNTITGSIGVFGMMFNTNKFFTEKLGVTFDAEKNGPYADLGNMNRPFTERERQIIQNGVDTVYATFKNRVATGRKMDVNYVDSIGQGRVWTGTAALKNGLIDGIGGLDRAFAAAAALSEIKKYNVVVYPKPVGQMESILKLMKNSNSVMSNLSVKMLEDQLGQSYESYQNIRMMQQSKNNIWMMMPFKY